MQATTGRIIAKAADPPDHLTGLCRSSVGTGPSPPCQRPNAAATGGKDATSARPTRATPRQYRDSAALQTGLRPRRCLGHLGGGHHGHCPMFASEECELLGMMARR
jgi:hypothetical protein